MEEGKARKYIERTSIMILVVGFLIVGCVYGLRPTKKRVNSQYKSYSVIVLADLQEVWICGSTSRTEIFMKDGRVRARTKMLGESKQVPWEIELPANRGQIKLWYKFFKPC